MRLRVDLACEIPCARLSLCSIFYLFDKNLMKTIVIILLSAFFIGCSADTSPNYAGNKDSEMSSKGKRELRYIFTVRRCAYAKRSNSC